MDKKIEQITLHVRGMTCTACEGRIQDALTAQAGIISAHADQATGKVIVDYEPALISLDTIRQSIIKAGYTISDTSISPMRSVLSLLGTAALVLALFMIVNATGIFSFIPTIDSSFSLAMVFVAGLLTSVHCVAMCGGIALSQSAKVIETTPLAGPKGFSLAKQKPAILYHTGRIIAYTVIGGIVGALGSVISFSPATKAALMIFAALFMLVLGLKMLGALPFLSKIKIKLPRIIPGKVINSLRNRGPFFVGLLNGLMPCGPLQTMQLYALGTGSALMGATSMLLFSLGTVPLMFAFGALSSFFSKTWQQRLVRLSSIMVVLFGALMFGRAMELSGVSLGGLSSLSAQTPPTIQSNTSTLAFNPQSNGAVATIIDGLQKVSFNLQPTKYEKIIVQKGIPVRWTINATTSTITGCNRAIVIPGLGIEKQLKPGANIIEFTPQQSGTIGYTCWMGMISSTIEVVDKLPANATEASPGAKKINVLPVDTSDAENPVGTMSCCQ